MRKPVLQARIDDLSECIEAQEQQLEKIVQQKFEGLVDTRNAFAVRRLREEKEEHLVAGKRLDVCCVSNANYSTLKGAEDATNPRVPADMIGIPALRKFILERAAPAQLATLEAHIEHKYALFMEGLALWSKSYTLDGSDDLLDRVAAPQDKVGGILERYLAAVVEVSGNIVVNKIKEELAEIIQQAKKELWKIRQMHWCTIRAFVRRDGNHSTSLVPESSWNENFLTGAKNIIKQRWPIFVEKQKELAHQLEHDLIALVTDIATAVQGKLRS